jgi:hypothetical protein
MNIDLKENRGNNTHVNRTGTREVTTRLSARRLFLVVLLMAGSLARGGVDIGVNSSYNGTAPASPTTPWINSLFQDIGPNTVQLTITAPNLSNPEYLQSLYLNFNDTKQVNSLVFTPVFSLWQGVDHNFTLDLSKNNETASTGGNYDILLGFSAAPGAARRFVAGDQVVFDITTSQAGTSLNSLDFAMRSVPGSAGSFYAAAFIQRTDTPPKDTDFAGATAFTATGVPEPAYGFAAAGLCLAGLIISLRRRFTRH